MEILVCIKQVPDDAVKVCFDKNTGSPDISGITPVVNAFDTYALEMAARFKEANEGNITVLSIGDEKSKDAIRNCLSVGADKGFLVCDEIFSDIGTFATATVLKAAISKIEETLGSKFDIIFCGRESTDFSSGVVGAQLAETMGLNMVSDIIAVSSKGRGLSVKQETEEGYNIIEIGTPCLFTVTKPDYDPRYPTMKSKIAARKADIPVFSASDLKISAADFKNMNSIKIIDIYPLKTREAGIKIKEKDAAEAVKKAVEIMLKAGVL
ncbi:MAG: electron transfer flavoprotein subunit beta/FixA family protein [Lachnospiraceae bacterium]|nr:electron transfer flavoprotein subunit beta/FixA family protein [Lachnospiraceae bacterium]